MSAPVFPRDVDRFTRAARAYCAWVEGPPPADAASDANTALRLIAELYAAALSLPGVHEDWIPDFADVPRPGSATSPAFKARFSAFPLQYYACVFDPLEAPPQTEPTSGDLLDDIADIYDDIKTGLIGRERNGEPAAIWLWRTTFGFHWGRHAVWALAALHAFDPDEI